MTDRNPLVLVLGVQKEMPSGDTIPQSMVNGLATDLSNKQPIDTDLTAIAALTSAADKILYATGAGTWSLTDFTTVARQLLDDTSFANMRATLNLTLTTSLLDTTAGSVLTAGYQGLGAAVHSVTDMTATDVNVGRIFRMNAAATGGNGLNMGCIALPTDGTPTMSYVCVALGGSAYIVKKTGAAATPTYDQIWTANTQISLGTTQASARVAIAAAPLASPNFTGNVDFAGNITFSSATAKVQADLSNATLTARMYVQSSTSNGASNFGVVPNGSSTSAAIAAYNAATPTNTAQAKLSVSNTKVSLESSVSGSGTALPIAVTLPAGDALNISTALNIGVGVSSPNTDCKLQISNGIKVGNAANAISTVFDWYDEPGWTPVTKGTTSAGTATPVGTPIGTSNRKGDECSIEMDIQQSAHNGSGNIKFGDLPFTSKAAIRQPLTISASGLAITAGNRLEAFIAASATEITVQQVTAAGVASAVPLPAGAATFLISGTYKVV